MKGRYSDTILPVSRIESIFSSVYSNIYIHILLYDGFILSKLTLKHAIKQRCYIHLSTIYMNIYMEG